LRHAPGHPGEIAAVDGNGKIRHHFTVLDNADVLDACKGLSITVARGFPDMVQRLRAAGATASMGDSRDPVALAREAGSGVLWL
jgi:hypothetical protein